jgi:anti-sigma factor RsiW
MSDANTHLTEAQVSAYLDRALEPAERSAVEQHLAACPECRQEAVESGRLAHGFRRRPVWAVGAGLAAAAAVFIALGTPARPPAEPPIVRAPGTGEGVPEVQVAAPLSGGSLPPGGALTWHPVAGASVYHVGVTDPAGRPVWADTTADTAVAAPLQPGRYFWYVDALLGDGRSATTGSIEVTVGK